MKLFLISISLQSGSDLTDISLLGARYLSSYLKSMGHEVNILFLAEPGDKKESKTDPTPIIELIEKLHPDLIGVSLMSNQFFPAAALTRAIKKNGSLPPVIWGGIHPTIRPEECLDFADLVCVGDGELAMEKLMGNLDRFKEQKIEGIWYKDGDKIIEGGQGMLISDIDSLPYPDYDLDNQYIMCQGKVIPLSVEILKRCSPASVGAHRLISSRGCPYACAYCCNSVFKKLYGGAHLRRRSVNNFIREMVEIKNKFPFIKRFKIMDDNFTGSNIEWIKEFNKEYKQKINLPFYCLFSPSTINEEKLDLLIDAGLNSVQIGLESGSDQINSQIYLRSAKASDFLKAMKLFEKYQGVIADVDVIVDNPYEGEEDLIKTINILNQIKRPFMINMSSLTFYPETALYQRAMTDKMLTDEDEYLRKLFDSVENDVLNIFNKLDVLKKIIYLTPHLTRQKINYLVNNRHRFLTRLYIGVLHLVYAKKNKLPPVVSKLISYIHAKFHAKHT